MLKFSGSSAAVTADYILKIFIEANAGKVEAAIQKAADEGPDAEVEIVPAINLRSCTNR